MKEMRKFDIYKVREMCIRNFYYTMGTNEDYCKMFEMCEEEATLENVIAVADDIIAHSDIDEEIEIYGSYHEFRVNLVWELINECCTTSVF